MKAQKPAQGILLQRDYGDAMTYTVPCECGCDEHSHHVWVEADNCSVTVTTYTTEKTNWWSKNRWHHIWQLLTKGYVEYEACVIMNEQQALNYAETLKQAISDVKTFKKPTKA